MKVFNKVILILFISISLTSVAFLIARKGLKKYNRHKNERLTEILTGNEFHDLVFIGSSRTHSTINPYILDSILGTNSYNLGIEGGNIFEFRMILNAYLATHTKPSQIVLTLDLSSLDIRRKFYNHTQYFPYLSNSVIDSTLNATEINTFFVKAIPFLEFVHYDDYTRSNIIKGLRGKTDIESDMYSYKGFLTSTKTMVEYHPKADSKKNIIVSPESIDLLEDIITTCSRKNIKLVLTYAPEFKKMLQNTYSNSQRVLEIYDSLAIAHDLDFLRHDTLSVCSKPSYFSNPGHVNSKGSKIYSIILGNELKKFQ